MEENKKIFQKLGREKENGGKNKRERSHISTKKKDTFFRSMSSFLFKSKAPDCHEGEVKDHTAAGACRGTD